MRDVDQDNIAVGLSLGEEWWGEPEKAIDEQEKLMFDAENIVDSINNIEPTAREVCLLYAYSFLVNHPWMTDDDKEVLVSKLKAMSELEAKYMSKDIPLPTMGLELEIPFELCVNYTHNKKSLR